MVVNNQAIRMLSLTVMFVSGCGLQHIQIQGALLVWLFVEIVLNRKQMKKIPHRDVVVMACLMGAFSILSIIKGVSNYPFVLVAMAIGYIAALNYRGKGAASFYDDMSKLCRYAMYYTFMHIPFLFFTGILSPLEGTFAYHFHRLFYFVDSGGMSFTNGFRLCGLAWEPGIWQMIMNFNLYFALVEKRSAKQIAMAISAVVLTLSTSGMFTMIVIILYYLSFVLKKIKIGQLAGMAIVGVFFYGIIFQNIDEKLNGEGATSSMVRFGDTYVGAMMLSKNPVIGANTELTGYSRSNDVIALRQYLWDEAEIKGDNEGFLNAYIVNGFMIFLLDWGLVIGLFLLYRMIKADFMEPTTVRIGFLLTILLTLFAEPISSTAFFFFFVIYGILGKRTKTQNGIGYART